MGKHLDAFLAVHVGEAEEAGIRGGFLAAEDEFNRALGEAILADLADLRGREAGEAPPYEPDPFRLAHAAELETLRWVIPHLSFDGLHEARGRLRDDQQRRAHTGVVAEAHADRLDAVCRRIAEVDGIPLTYFADDVLPEVPDYLPDDGGCGPS